MVYRPASSPLYVYKQNKHLSEAKASVSGTSNKLRDGLSD